MAGDSEDKPSWWTENETLKREMELPTYEPPRFEDGTFTHEVVEPLEAEYDCVIQFRSDLNPAYPEDWELRIDYEPVTRIARHRDENGNTVYEITPSAFRRIVERHCRS